jgi:nickel-dependent lactate racemase
LVRCKYFFSTSGQVYECWQKSIYQPWNSIGSWTRAQEAKFMPFGKKKEKPKPEEKKPAEKK